MESSNLFSVVPDKSLIKIDDEAGMLSSDNCEDLAKVTTRNTQRDIIHSLQFGNDYPEYLSSEDDDIVILNDKDGSDWIENGKVNVLTSALQKEDHKNFTFESSDTPNSNPDVGVEMPDNYIKGTSHESADPIQCLLPLPQLEDPQNSRPRSTEMSYVKTDNCVQMIENSGGGGTDHETAVAIQSLLLSPKLEDSPNYLVEMCGAAAGHQTVQNVLSPQLKESQQVLGSYSDKLVIKTDNCSEMISDNDSNWANAEANSCPQNFAFGPKPQDSVYPSNKTSGQADDSDDEVQILYVKNSTSILNHNNETFTKRQSNKNIDYDRNLDTCCDKRKDTPHIKVENENVWSNLKNKAVKISPKKTVYKKLEDYFPKMPNRNFQFPKLEKSYINIKQEVTEVLPKATEKIILETDIKKEFTKYPNSRFPSLVNSYINRKQEAAEILPKATEKIILKTDSKLELSKYSYDISSEICGNNYSQKQDLLFKDMIRMNDISQTIENIIKTSYSYSNSEIGIKHTDPAVHLNALLDAQEAISKNSQVENIVRTPYSPLSSEIGINHSDPTVINALLDAQKDNSKKSQKGSKKKSPPSDDTKVIRNMIKKQDGHQKTENDEADEDEEELGHAETYADYMPSKLKIGIKHPDAVVETSSLSSVQPPDTYYNLSIPEDVIDSGLLSALQLEAITYACQKHEHILPDGNRAGFLIGDGAGVGKGRTLAGIIYENYLLGRKRAIWLSVSNDLKYDAERDLSDIGAARIEVCSLSKLKYAKISSKANGSFKKGVIFATYSSLVGKSHSGGIVRTRLNQLVEWCGSDFEGCIVFDECHKAKNICPVGSSKPSRTGLTVLQLQNMLPKARIVYASATGACEPRHMAYMTRLGLWGESTPFREFMAFAYAVEKRGVGAMEMVSMDMKLRGLYIARQLSFAGVTFKIEEIALSQELITMYDKAVALWVEAHVKFQEAANLLKGDYTDNRTMLSQFWAAHQRFFKYLCIASKVKHVVQLTKEALKNGNCVVIGLQSTGEARTLDQLEEFGGELCDFVSSAKGVFQSLVEKHFPAIDKSKTVKLLGLDFEDYQNSSPSPKPSPVGCRKRRATRAVVKRYKVDPEINSREQSDDSDFQASGDESIENGSKSSSVGLSSDTENGNLFIGSNYERENDCNPFNAGSDSDDPWIPRQNESKTLKGKKRKIKRDSEAQQLTSSRDVIEKTLAMKVELIQKIEELGSILPPNTLDQLIDELGGPENVAEMTGRKGRIVSDVEDGTKRYESRSVQLDVSLEKLNMIEKEKFMRGEKLIAIISEAASSGISLQSDRRVKNQARRVHVTLELPWSADRAIQQFGRTHRSNQVNAPEYLFLISDLAGERRFASIVAKRLESLGALTQGDRRATESKDLSQFNIDNKYGRIALETTLATVMGLDLPLVPPPSDYVGNFFYDIRQALIGVAMVVPDKLSGFLVLNKDSGNMSKFLNRILGLPVALQNRLFQYFSDTLDDIVAQAIKAGRYDRGILDLGATGDLVKKVQSEEFVQKYTIDRNKTELHTVLIERGMSWEAALQKLKQCYDPDEGFYLARQTRNYKRTAVLAVRDSTQRSGGKMKEKLLRIYRPNTGLNPKPETVKRLNVLYTKVTEKEVERHWKQNYKAALTECSHWYWYGQCRRRTLGFTCEVGLRLRQYHVLSGSVLAVWTEIEHVLYDTSSATSKLQIVRLRMEDGSRIVGCLIPNNSVERLRKVLRGEESASFLGENLD